jgi:hypothetical protein
MRLKLERKIRMACRTPFGEVYCSTEDHQTPMASIRGEEDETESAQSLKGSLPENRPLFITVQLPLSLSPLELDS